MKLDPQTKLFNYRYCLAIVAKLFGSYAFEPRSGLAEDNSGFISGQNGLLRPLPISHFTNIYYCIND